MSISTNVFHSHPDFRPPAPLGWRFFLMLAVSLCFIAVGASVQAQTHGQCLYSLKNERAQPIKVYEVLAAGGERQLAEFAPGNEQTGSFVVGTRLRVKVVEEVIGDLVVPDAPAAFVTIPAEKWAPRGGGKAAPPAGTGSKVTPAEARAIVAAHNRARTQVRVGPVEWSNELAAYAQEWADHLAATAHQRSNRDVIVHRDHGKYGENLFAGTGGVDGETACEKWWEEKEKYVYGRKENLGTGHYTQMVWRGTRKIGMGKARSATGWTIYVCNYDPPGNYIGKKPY